jgi:hypothetical protein
MTVRAITDFTDAHGHKRVKGDTWKMSCEGCALGLIKAKRVVRVITKPKQKP